MRVFDVGVDANDNVFALFGDGSRAQLTTERGEPIRVMWQNATVECGDAVTCAVGKNEED